MSKKIEKNLFKKSRTSRYYSPRFFPKGVRDDIFKFYSFIKVVDDCVNGDPADIESFKYIVRRWQKLKKINDYGRFEAVDDSIAERVLGNICYIIHRFDCDPNLIDEFLRAKAMDLKKKRYTTMKDVARYMARTSEVIAVMLVQIMQLPNAAIHFAKVQGRALQYLSFIRDFAEDYEAKRIYFSTMELKKFGLTNVNKEDIKKNPRSFNKFISLQLKRYQIWQEEANKGYQFVPIRLKVPLMNAVQAYGWTAKKIEKNPLIILDKVPQPSRAIKARNVVFSIVKK